jgi:hypothetical protein
MEGLVTLVAKPDRRRSARLALGEYDIARRAFELYCARGQRDGHDLDDWLQAERDLNQPVTRQCR